MQAVIIRTEPDDRFTGGFSLGFRAQGCPAYRAAVRAKVHASRLSLPLRSCCRYTRALRHEAACSCAFGSSNCSRIYSFFFCFFFFFNSYFAASFLFLNERILIVRVRNNRKWSAPGREREQLHRLSGHSLCGKCASSFAFFVVARRLLLLFLFFRSSSARFASFCLPLESSGMFLHLLLPR